MALKLLRYLRRRLRQDSAAHAPVFLFAASWRTGSTLLQRIICASESIFLWGEPRFLPQAMKLRDRLLRIHEESAQAVGEFSDFTPGAWRPVLFPGKDAVDDSLRAFFLRLYFEPVRARAYSRWGFKEVRTDAVPCARFLHELFPDARILFLVRNPLDMYRSLKNRPFFARFDDPMQPVRTWAANAGALLDALERGDPPAMLVRYEDLVAPDPCGRETITRICAHIGVPCTGAMLQEARIRVGESAYHNTVSAKEHERILAFTGTAAERLGYALRAGD